MGVRTDTRSRMVASAALLLRERGVAGTTVAGVLAHSHGPRGSVAYHFPGGRGELLIDALAWAGAQVTERLRGAATTGTDPAVVFGEICRRYQDHLVNSGFTAGCPIGAAMQEVHHDDLLGPVVGDIVSDWHDALADLLLNAGHLEADARELASLAISALEGAIMMARVNRSSASLEALARRIAPMLAAPDSAAQK